MAADAYMQGWALAGTAVDMYLASLQNGNGLQGAVAAIYLGIWIGAHIALVAGANMLAWAGIAYVIRAAVGCASNLLAGCREKVALDANTVINAIEKGATNAVDKAIAGRIPVITQSAANEYLVKGNLGALNNFLSQRGGKIVGDVSLQMINALQVQATSLGRALSVGDASVLGAAMRDGLSIMTRDARFLRYLNFIGYPGEGF